METDFDRLRLEAKVNLTTALLARRMAEIQILSEALASAHADNARLTQAADSQIHAVFASTSWRITAPLRQISSFLRSHKAKPHDR